MKIVLLNAGAKKDGATQEILQTIYEAVPSNGTASLICLGDADIRYCRGCKACYDTGVCVHRDGMESIIDTLDDADIWVVAAPSYWADVPGQFKVFIDRCTVYGDTNPHPTHRVLKTGKKCYAVSLRTGNRPIECQHIIESIGHWCGHMKVEMADSLYFCGIADREDVARHKDQIRKKAQAWFHGN